MRVRTPQGNARSLAEHGLRVEVWPWRYIAADGRTGAEAVLVSMPKAVDICVYESPLDLA